LLWELKLSILELAGKSCEIHFKIISLENRKTKALRIPMPLHTAAGESGVI
jgi:hypothetical protein